VTKRKKKEREERRRREREREREREGEVKTHRTGEKGKFHKKGRRGRVV